MPASLLNELTAPVRPPKQANPQQQQQQQQNQGKGKTQSGSAKNGKANGPQQKKTNNGKAEEATPVTTTAAPEAVGATATTPTPTTTCAWRKLAGGGKRRGHTGWRAQARTGPCCCPSCSSA